MLSTIRKSAMTVAALSAFGLGGAALAGADNPTAATTPSSGPTPSQMRPAPPQREALSSEVAAKVKAAALEKVPGATVLRTEAGGPGGPGGHGGHNETALTGDTKQKVGAAVLAKYSGATIVRTESNDDSSAPYESHIKTSAGQELEVTVGKAFEIVDAHAHPSRP